MQDNKSRENSTDNNKYLYGVSDSGINRFFENKLEEYFDDLNLEFDKYIKENESFR